MAIDLDRVRADTPAASTLTFLDNAGSALSPLSVTETVIDYLRLEQQVGGYAAMEQHQERITAVNASAGRLVGVPSEQVALQTSATAAWMRACLAVPLTNGDRILTTKAEYASNVLPLLQLAERYDATVEFIPNGDDGTASPEALGDMLDERVRVVAITHAASHNGLVVDAQAIGSTIRSAGSSAWYLLDACQSVGQIPLDLATLQADFLTATGRKFLRGPRGTGFLAVSPRVLNELEPFPIDMFGVDWDGATGYQLHPTAARFQSFETSYASVLGLGAAIDYALEFGLTEIQASLTTSADNLRALLSRIPGVRVADRGKLRSAIVVFAVPGDDPWPLVRLLRERNVIVTAVTRPTNPIDIDGYGATCLLRASPHVFTTSDDCQHLADEIATIVSG